MKSPLSLLRRCPWRLLLQCKDSWLESRTVSPEEEGLQFVNCPLIQAHLFSSITRLAPPQACKRIPGLTWAAQRQIAALTLAAKLDVSQVIRDPRVPVHFGNKVGVRERRNHRDGGKGWVARRIAAWVVMQRQKAVCQYSRTDREERQVALERGRGEGGRGGEGKES